jgi:hypothetical protein
VEFNNFLTMKEIHMRRNDSDESYETQNNPQNEGLHDQSNVGLNKIEEDDEDQSPYVML